MFDISALLSLKPTSPVLDQGQTVVAEAAEFSSFGDLLSMQVGAQAPLPVDAEVSLSAMTVAIVNADEVGKRQADGKILPDGLPAPIDLAASEGDLAELMPINRLDRLLVDRAELATMPTAPKKANPAESKARQRTETPKDAAETAAEIAPGETEAIKSADTSLIALAAASVEPAPVVAAAPVVPPAPVVASATLAPARRNPPLSVATTIDAPTPKAPPATISVPADLLVAGVPTAPKDGVTAPGPAVAEALVRPPVVPTVAASIAPVEGSQPTAQVAPVIEPSAPAVATIQSLQPTPVVTPSFVGPETGLMPPVATDAQPSPIRTNITAEPAITTRASAPEPQTVTIQAAVVAAPPIERAAEMPQQIPALAIAPAANVGDSSTGRVAEPPKHPAAPAMPTTAAPAVEIPNNRIATTAAKPRGAPGAARRSVEPVAAAAAEAPASATRSSSESAATAPATPQPAPLLTEVRQSVIGTAGTLLTPTVPTETPQDFAALVDRLIAARDTAAPQAVQATVSHADFGRVSLDFRQDGGALTVGMTSADPSFAPAVLAALATDRSAAASDFGRQTQADAPPQAMIQPVMQAQAQQSMQSQTQSQGQSQNQQANPSNQNNSASLQQNAAGQSDSSGQGRNGGQERSGRYQSNPSATKRDTGSSQLRRGTYA